jgi:hypothetical protein
MTCRLAKESDTIILLHIPCTAHLVSRNTDFFQAYDSQDLHASSEEGFKPANPSYSRLTAGMYRALLVASAQRKEQLLAHYNSLGYNLYCVEARRGSNVPYFSAINSAAKSYAAHIAYAAQQATLLGLPDDSDTLDRCANTLFAGDTLLLHLLMSACLPAIGLRSINTTSRSAP